MSDEINLTEAEEKRLDAVWDAQGDYDRGHRAHYYGEPLDPKASAEHQRGWNERNVKFPQSPKK